MLSIDEAIRIAKILEYAPEGRLPLIVDVFNKAGVDIDSLQCAVGCRTEELLEEAAEAFSEHKGDDGLYRIPATDFTAFCKRKGADPYRTRAELASMEILQASSESEKGKKYSMPVRKDGKVIRCIILKLD